MAEGFKNRTPEEQRQLADSVLAEGFTALAKAIQEVGLCAMVSRASDREIRIINAPGSPVADGEFTRILEGTVIQICMDATDAYVEAARRAMRFDEQEDSADG